MIKTYIVFYVTIKDGKENRHRLITNINGLSEIIEVSQLYSIENEILKQIHPNEEKVEITGITPLKEKEDGKADPTTENTST